MHAIQKPVPPSLARDLDHAKLYKNGAQPKTATFDDSIEKAMYDEIFGKVLNKPTQPSRPTSSTNSDFNSSIIARLKAVEAEAKDLRLKLSEQLAINSKLESENDDLKKALDVPDQIYDELAKVKEDNHQLRLQIEEMNKFLSDYGLVWVGSQQNSNEVDLESETHPMSYSVFTHHIDELNSVIYSEPAQIIKEGERGQKARLGTTAETLETIPITYYSNGLMIKRGPFRYCGTDSYSSFVRDIIDGFFPTEFKNDHPNGVVFKIIDKHSVEYHENTAQQQGATNITTVEGQDPTNAMTKEQFFNRLPKTVLKNGTIVNVREDIASRFDNSKSSNSTESKQNNESTDSKSKSSANNIINTPAYEAMQESNNNNNSLGKIVQVQIKGFSSAVLMAYMYEVDTVAQLKQYIETSYNNATNPHTNYRESPASVTEIAKLPFIINNNTTGRPLNLELRTAFPSKVLSNGMTMNEAGLVPNGTVYVRVL